LEIGKLERTLLLLEYIQNIELRKRIHAGLNKGEARNALARQCSLTDWGNCATAPTKTSSIEPAA
jgi:TnpA family transposase